MNPFEIGQNVPRTRPPPHEATSVSERPNGAPYLRRETNGELETLPTSTNDYVSNTDAPTRRQVQALVRGLRTFSR